MENLRNNRYGLLDDDDEGTKVIPSNVEKPVKKPVPTKAPTNLKKEKENKSGALNKEQAAKKGGDLPQKKTSDNASKQVSFKSNYNQADRESGERQKSQNSNRENRTFRNRENAGYRTGKREFDRQSGSDRTGVKAVDKRDGAGAHNWGSVKEEIDNIKTNGKAEVEGTLTDKDDSNNEQAPEPTAVPEEDDSKKMTLDEWKALQKQREKPKFNLRKPGEGEDTSQWKKMFLLNKKSEGDSEEELEFDPSMYPQRVGRLQRVVDIQFNFNDSRRGGFNRFKKGPKQFGGNTNDQMQYKPNVERFHSGKNRHSNNKREHSDVVNIDSDKQFPTLG